MSRKPPTTLSKAKVMFDDFKKQLGLGEMNVKWKRSE
jgi:hypothetical protein